MKERERRVGERTGREVRGQAMEGWKERERMEGWKERERMVLMWSL